MSATEVAADLRDAAQAVRYLTVEQEDRGWLRGTHGMTITEAREDLVARLEALADSFDQPPWEEAEIAARVAVDDEDAVDALMAIKDAGFVVLRPAAVSAQEEPQ